MSRADSRVRSPGTFPCARCPAGTSALDAGPEACHNLAAVWWGVFAASVVIRDRVVIVRPLLVSSVNSADVSAPAWKAYRTSPSSSTMVKSIPPNGHSRANSKASAGGNGHNHNPKPLKPTSRPYMPLLPGGHNNSDPAGGSSEACLRGSRDSMIEASRQR